MVTLLVLLYYRRNSVSLASGMRERASSLSWSTLNPENLWKHNVFHSHRIPFISRSNATLKILLTRPTFSTAMMVNHGVLLVHHFTWRIHYRISWGIDLACLTMHQSKWVALRILISFT